MKVIIAGHKYEVDANEGPYEEQFEAVTVEQFGGTIYLSQMDELYVSTPPGKFESLVAISIEQAESLYNLLGEALGKNK